MTLAMERPVSNVTVMRHKQSSKKWSPKFRFIYSLNDLEREFLMKKFQAWRSVIEFSFPLILVPFLGAWSDVEKNRRKPVMLFALSGRYLFLFNPTQLNTL
jgi:hypothetical protein